MKKSIGKINGCNIVLIHKDKYKDVSRARIECAEKLLRNVMAIELHYDIAEKLRKRSERK